MRSGEKDWAPCISSYIRCPTSRCSTSSFVKSVASSLNGSPSCTKPGRFRAPLGHSMPVRGEKENVRKCAQTQPPHHSQPGRKPHWPFQTLSPTALATAYITGFPHLNSTASPAMCRWGTGGCLLVIPPYNLTSCQNPKC